MKALIAMSGGVDSSVAAFLMKEQGYKCIGCTMKLYENEDAGISNGKTCCSADDAEDAGAVSRRLGMPYYVFNYTEEFREKIIGRFVDSYVHGITPNPCIDCNRYMKFGRLYREAEILGCDKIVTGHYVRVVEENGKYLLKKGLDETKDQSYVLYSLTQDQLAHTVFPLGELRKTEVRAIAEQNGFVNANKKESQDICFVPDGDYARIVELHTGKKSQPGYYVDTEDNVLGVHKGLIHYTVGQHKGLGIQTPVPMYVQRLDTERNEVVLCRSEELFSRTARVRDMNWISGEVPKKDLRCKAKVRYRQPEQWAEIHIVSDSEIEISFDEPQRAITPGQSAVLYDGDTVLGGGIIY